MINKKMIIQSVIKLCFFMALMTLSLPASTVQAQESVWSLYDSDQLLVDYSTSPDFLGLYGQPYWFAMTASDYEFFVDLDGQPYIYLGDSYAQYLYAPDGNRYIVYNFDKIVAYPSDRTYYDYNVADCLDSNQNNLVEGSPCYRTYYKPTYYGAYYEYPACYNNPYCHSGSIDPPIYYGGYGYDTPSYHDDYGYNSPTYHNQPNYDGQYQHDSYAQPHYQNGPTYHPYDNEPHPKAYHAPSYEPQPYHDDAQPPPAYQPQPHHNNGQSYQPSPQLDSQPSYDGRYNGQ